MSPPSSSAAGFYLARSEARKKKRRERWNVAKAGAVRELAGTRHDAVHVADEERLGAVDAVVLPELQHVGAPAEGPRHDEHARVVQRRDVERVEHRALEELDVRVNLL